MGKRIISILAIAAALAGPGRADVDMGAYLAARAAMAQTDFAAATPWLDAALQADPDSVPLLMTMLAARVGTGDFVGALPFADQMVALGAAESEAATTVYHEDPSAVGWTVSSWRFGKL
mgnify:CR=1 FL=1